jgi:5-methylcytosine-specific restriction endonuclease McrA
MEAWMWTNDAAETHDVAPGSIATRSEHAGKDDVEIVCKEKIQAGDVFLLKFNCPRCCAPMFQGYPLRKCDRCELDFWGMPLILGSKRRLLAGTRRKKVGLSKKRVQALYELCGGRCAYCSVLLKGIEYHIDHILPIAVGGTNQLYNLVLACRSCNCTAGARVFGSVAAKSEYIRKQRGKRFGEAEA